MLMSIFLIFLISIQNLHGLICYSNGTFYFSKNEFNWNNFSNNINHQTTSNVYSCHVRITVDNNHYIIIKFHPIINYSKPNIEFGSTIIFLKNQIQSTISYLDYTCSSGNLCDKIFIQKWSKQLFNDNENSLQKNFISLWKYSNICQEKFKTNSCESYLCFTIYNELKNLSYGKFQCEDKFSTNPININIKTYSGNIYNEYQCIKNHCTGDILYNSLIKKNLTEYFINNQNEKQLILKRTIIIVSILAIIGCIAYYIQCRKYKQGYRLTINA